MQLPLQISTLVHKAVGARGLSSRPAIRRIVRRDEDDQRGILKPLYASGGLYAVQAGRAIIQQNQFRPQLEGFSNCLAAIAGRADEIETGLKLQYQGNGLQPKRAIIGYECSHQAGRADLFLADCLHGIHFSL
jgi:hypothetical protein